MAIAQSNKYDTGQIKGVLSKVSGHIMAVLLLKKLDMDTLDVNMLHFGCVAIIYSLAAYLGYLLGNVMHLKAFKLLLSIIFPAYALISVIAFGLYAFVAGNVYGNLLSDYRFSNYYIVLLGGAYIPLAVLLSGIFSRLLWPSFISAGVIAEMFTRDTLTSGRTWEDDNDKYYFFGISLAMTLGVYGFIMPYFFVSS